MNICPHLRHLDLKKVTSDMREKPNSQNIDNIKTSISVNNDNKKENIKNNDITSNN